VPENINNTKQVIWENLQVYECPITVVTGGAIGIILGTGLIATSYIAVALIKAQQIQKERYTGHFT
jgi:hypothetical protein